MKIVVIDNTSHISIRPDNAVLRNNDPFYIPDFSEDIVCTLGYIVRITRLAKCIAPKFAFRCYDSITAGVTFVARDIMQQALQSGRCSDEAYCFDHSTAIGVEWLTPDQISGNSTLSAQIGGNNATITQSNLIELIEQSISAASKKLTLKTGDLIFIAIEGETPVKEGDSVDVTLDGCSSLSFQIR